MMRLTPDYYVRPLDEADLSGPYPSWFNDPEVSRYNSHGVFAQTATDFQNFFDDLGKGRHVVWAICSDRDGHVGNIGLHNLSFVNRNAEFSILIGERSHWGKGVGLAAGAIIITHGFSRLNLERIYCATAATNAGMSALAESLGMREEGRRRRALFLEGDWVDAVEYGILRSEFTEPQGQLEK